MTSAPSKDPHMELIRAAKPQLQRIVGQLVASGNGPEDLVFVVIDDDAASRELAGELLPDVALKPAGPTISSTLRTGFLARFEDYLAVVFDPLTDYSRVEGTFLCWCIAAGESAILRLAYGQGCRDEN